MTTSDVFLFLCRRGGGGGGGGFGGQLAVVRVLVDEYKVKLSVLIHLGRLYFTVLAGMSVPGADCVTVMSAKECTCRGVFDTNGNLQIFSSSVQVILI